MAEDVKLLKFKTENSWFFVKKDYIYENKENWALLR